jgi:hypothetical protein
MRNGTAISVWLNSYRPSGGACGPLETQEAAAIAATSGGKMRQNQFIGLTYPPSAADQQPKVDRQTTETDRRGTAK